MKSQMDLGGISFNQNGRTALVTGAGSGIGLGIATELAKAGAHVLINDLDVSRARRVADELRAEAVPGDITDSAFLSLIGGRSIDILVNNAGFQHVAPIEDFPPDVFRKMLDVMLIGPFVVTQAVIPGMKSRGFGRVINIGSVHSKIASAYKSGYVAAKHGLLGLTRTLGVELAQTGITVNAICPGYVDTPLVKNQIPALAERHGIAEDDVIAKVVLQSVPMKRLITPEEIGQLALYLCSDAARAVTAQGYSLDAGWSQV